MPGTIRLKTRGRALRPGASARVRAGTGHHLVGLFARRETIGGGRLSRNASLASRRIGPIGALVGLSDRIESVRFSRDGSRLLVVGGNPCRMGEVQVWDVAGAKLLRSLSTTSDTLYGGSWSADGSLISFGAADNTVRVLEATRFTPVVTMAAHDDWVRGTVFSADGKSLFSASR